MLLMIALILKIAFGLVILVVAGIAIIWALGSRLPREHVVSRAIFFPKTPSATAWQMLTNYSAQPKWRSDLQSNTQQPDRDGHEVWRNEMKGGDSLTVEISESDPPRRLVTQIVDTGGPFGGKWVYKIEPAGTGSRLTIVEEGWVKPAMFRAIGKYFIGYETTMENFMKDLARCLHESAAPQQVSPAEPK